MSLFDSFLKLDIQKLFLKGDIAKAYEKIYEVAERIAGHEMKRRLELFHDKAKKKTKNSPQEYQWKFTEEMAKYKERRTQHHINEMKGLLKLRKEII